MAIIKDILVHVDNTSACEFRVKRVTELAERLGAHLMGLYVRPQPMPAGYLDGDIGVFVDDGSFNTNNPQIQARIQMAATSAESVFRGVLHHHQIEEDWKVVVGSMVREICFWTQHMDLAIIGRLNPSATGTGISAVGEILLSIGRPVMILPDVHIHSHIGEHILIAWQPQQEAARAVSDSLAFLRSAKSVTVVAVETHSNHHDMILRSLEALERHLRRHRVAPRMRSIRAEGKSISERILEEAENAGTDLVVCGAYGHSRLRELIFGGVTRSLLENSNIPLLMSH